MPRTGALADRVVHAEPLGRSGASGNPVERVTLDDGRRLVRKRVSPEWDWISRATGDDGRALTMWTAGVFDRIPAVVDHATVGVEAEGSGWAVYMRDVSSSLVAPDAILDRAGVRRVLAAMAEVHVAFRGSSEPGLCGIEDRYGLLSPRTARRESSDLIARCWEVFVDLVPDEVAGPVVRLAEQPEPLADALRACEQTLVHGDVRLSNLGLTDDRVVVIDWGERTGTAPASVDVASFLVFDARRIEPTKEEVLEDFRAIARDVLDERALQLALIGAMVQLGPHPVLDLVLTGAEDARAAAVEELAWWTRTVANAFESTWSPA